MNLLKDSYFGTTCLLFEPRVIAAAAVHLSSMILDCVPPARSSIPDEPTQLVSPAAVPLWGAKYGVNGPLVAH